MLQFDVYTRNARLDVIETMLGVSPVLRVRTGAPPASCALPDFGTCLATLILPEDWISAAINAAKSKSGTWQDLYADATGIAGHFRLYTSDGICRLQGTFTATDGGGDMTGSTTGFSAGQYIKVLTFTINEQNA